MILFLSYQIIIMCYPEFSLSSTIWHFKNMKGIKEKIKELTGQNKSQLFYKILTISLLLSLLCYTSIE